MGVQLTTLGATAWLAAGALLGAGALGLVQRLRHWREARLAAEWDPY